MHVVLSIREHESWRPTYFVCTSCVSGSQLICMCNIKSTVKLTYAQTTMLTSLRGVQTTGMLMLKSICSRHLSPLVAHECILSLWLRLIEHAQPISVFHVHCSYRLASTAKWDWTLISCVSSTLYEVYNALTCFAIWLSQLKSNFSLFFMAC